jgi:hypothetical protein
MTTSPGPARAAPSQASAKDQHRLHSQTGARTGQHPGRPSNPLVMVAGLDRELRRFDGRPAALASTTIRAAAIWERRQR